MKYSLVAAGGAAFAASLCLAALGAQTAVKPQGGDEAVTPEALVWVATQYMDDPSLAQKAEGSAYTDAGHSGAQSKTTFNDIDESRLSLGVVDLLEEEYPTTCEGFVEDNWDGCEIVDGALVHWQLEEPEEDPGIMEIILKKDNNLAVAFFAGTNLTQNPIEMENLPMNVDDIIETLQDPRFNITTSKEAIEGGDTIDYFGELTQD